MANWLIFNFNLFNDSLQKGINRGTDYFCIDIIIDGYTVERVSGSRKIKLPEGEHEISCILRFQCGTDLETYHTKTFAFSVGEEEVVFTFNLYHLTYERSNDGFDFGPGYIPRRPPKKSGCYIATCVYGSYDCPQVWTLRRYRDNILAQTWYGRAFIRLYYSVSPKLVRLFGKSQWFKKAITPALNKLVISLNKNGFENTFYEDKN